MSLNLRIKDNDALNICQVSLSGNIPIIIQNIKKFKSYYKNINVYLICPDNEISIFKKKVNLEDVSIISENKILSKKKFNKIFFQLSKNYKYKNFFKERLSWYYQQILKISFLFFFVQNYKKNMIIWDADTLIVNKIDFFKNSKSVKYGTFSEFHTSYYEFNKNFLGKLPKYFISYLVQFVGLTFQEFKHINKKFKIKNSKINTISVQLTKKILNLIFKINKNYNGSLFSEFELIGMSNYNYSPKMQLPLLNLRKGLNGCFTKKQIRILKFLNFHHVTYEHTHPNKPSIGMLKRSIKWSFFFNILIKNLIKFNFKYIKHRILYFLKLKF